MARVTEPLDVRRGFKTAADYLAEERAKPSSELTDALWRFHTFATAVGGSARASRALSYGRGYYHLAAMLEDAGPWPRGTGPP